MQNKIYPAVAGVLALMLTACQTTPGPEKDYTLKMVKLSPAPRERFYKIIKVPKPGPEAPVESGTTKAEN